MKMELLCLRYDQIFIDHSRTLLAQEQVFVVEDNHLKKRVDNHTTFCLDQYKSADCYYDKVEQLDECFIYYNNCDQLSYCHFLTQTAPKLLFYVENKLDIPILIPFYVYNKLIYEIISLFGKQDKIKIMEPNVKYVIKKTVDGGTYYAPPCLITQVHVNFYKLMNSKLRDLTASRENTITNTKRNIFISRKESFSKDYNNLSIGSSRECENEQELVGFLKDRDFECITLGDKSLEAKYSSLRGAHTVVTHWGANCMNFIFFEGVPTNIIIIGNERSFSPYYYKTVLEGMWGDTVPNYVFISCESTINTDHTNSGNSRYRLNMKDLEDVFRSLKN